MSTDSTGATVSTDSTGAAVSSVVTRYSRTEEIVSWALVAAAILFVVTALYTLPPFIGVAVAVVAMLTLQRPVCRLHSDTGCDGRVARGGS